MRLPRSVEEIAEVIGRERALFLVGKLPRCYHQAKGCWHVILYVPKRMPLDHELVRLMGYQDAEKLRKAFGGEIMQPATCIEVYRRFRDASIRRLHFLEQTSIETLAAWFEMTPRHVRNLLQSAPGTVPLEISQEGTKAANDDHSATVDRKAG